MASCVINNVNAWHWGKELLIPWSFSSTDKFKAVIDVKLTETIFLIAQNQLTATTSHIHNKRTVKAIFKVCVNRKLLLTLLQCSNIFPSVTEYWIEDMVLCLRSSTVSHSYQSNGWSGVFNDILPKQSNWHLQRRNAILVQKQIFSFCLKITKTNFFFFFFSGLTCTD